MKYTGVILLCFLSVVFVRSELDESCSSNNDCDEKNREVCNMPTPTGGPTVVPDGTTQAATDGSTDATGGPTETPAHLTVTDEPYTCQCKSGYHRSTVNKTLCAKDLTDDDITCELQIDCDEIDYPRDDYETKFEANPICDHLQELCRCGEVTDVKTWVIAMNGSNPMCYHNAIKDNGKLTCEYDQECQFLSKKNEGDGICNDDNVCECQADGFDIYELKTCEVAIGGPCKSNDDCSKIQHASCSMKDGKKTGTCECNSGYPDRATSFICSSAASLMSSIVTLLVASIFTRFSV